MICADSFGISKNVISLWSFGLLNLDHLVECDPGGIAVDSILETLDAILNFKAYLYLRYV